MKEIGSEQRRHGRWSDTRPSSKASAVSTADRGATDKRSHAGHERNGGDGPRDVAIKEKNLEHEDAVRNVCADHSNPPTLLQKKEAHEVRMKCTQLDWYNQEL